MLLSTKARLAKILTLLATRFKPVSELNFSSAFECLVAVMLSPQTTDKLVNIATAKLFKLANTPSAVLSLPSSTLLSCLKNLSFYRTKAKHLTALSKMLITKFKGCVPSTFSDLTALPGVGPKVARVVLNSYFNQPEIAVDTHVLRVAKRLQLTKHLTPEAVTKDLVRLTTKTNRLSCGQLLLLHGRYTCTARKPRCKTCLIKPWCDYADA